MHACMLSRFSHVQLCDPMKCSPPGSSVHGILQARILEWVAISFSRGSSLCRDPLLSLPRWQAGSLPLVPPGKPLFFICHIYICIFIMFSIHAKGFPGGSMVKNPPANAGDMGSSLRSGRSPGEGNGNPLQYSCQGNPMTEKLTGYSLRGCKNSYTS